MMQVHVPPGSKLHGVTIRELRLPRTSVVTLIVRDGEPFPVGPDRIVRSGDDLLIVTNGDDRRKVEERLRSISASGRLGHWLAR
jgi:cell volume regulation protein A